MQLNTQEVTQRTQSYSSVPDPIGYFDLFNYYYYYLLRLLELLFISSLRIVSSAQLMTAHLRHP